MNAPPACALQADYDTELGRWRISTVDRDHRPPGGWLAGSPNSESRILYDPIDGALELVVDDAGSPTALSDEVRLLVHRFAGRQPEDITRTPTEVHDRSSWVRLAIALDTLSTTTGDPRRWAAVDTTVELRRLGLEVDNATRRAIAHLHGPLGVVERVAAIAAASVQSLGLRIDIQTAAMPRHFGQPAPIGLIVGDGCLWLHPGFVNPCPVDVSWPCHVTRTGHHLAIRLPIESGVYPTTVVDTAVLVMDQANGKVIGLAPLTVDDAAPHPTAIAHLTLNESRSGPLEMLLLGADRPAPQPAFCSRHRDRAALRRALAAWRLGDRDTSEAWIATMTEPIDISTAQLDEPIIADGLVPPHRPNS